VKPCTATTASGGNCRGAAGDDGLCTSHRRRRDPAIPRCGHTKPYGGTCASVVSAPGTRCPRHAPERLAAVEKQAHREAVAAATREIVSCDSRVQAARADAERFEYRARMLRVEIRELEDQIAVLGDWRGKSAALLHNASGLLDSDSDGDRERARVMVDLAREIRLAGGGGYR